MIDRSNPEFKPIEMGERTKLPIQTIKHGRWGRTKNPNISGIRNWLSYYIQHENTSQY